MTHYQVTYQGYRLEGEAKSPQNAVRKAIRTLIQQKKITRQPQSIDGGFKDVEVIKLSSPSSAPTEN